MLRCCVFSRNISSVFAQRSYFFSTTFGNTSTVGLDGRVYATGRRKTSVARVWVSEGSGQFFVNKRNAIDYFEPLQREHSIEPFAVTHTAGLFDIWCTVKGGGPSGKISSYFSRQRLVRADVLALVLMFTSVYDFIELSKDKLEPYGSV